VISLRVSIDDTEQMCSMDKLDIAAAENHGGDIFWATNYSAKLDIIAS
jgi:hypothetical protein